MILKATVEEAKSNQRPILLVLFYRYKQLKVQVWEEKFIKEVLSEIDVTYLDIKSLFLKTSNGDYYIIANAIKAYLSEDKYLQIK